MIIKLGEGKVFTGSGIGPKIFLARMLTGDLFAVANLPVTVPFIFVAREHTLTYRSQVFSVSSSVRDVVVFTYCHSFLDHLWRKWANSFWQICVHSYRLTEND